MSTPVLAAGAVWDEGRAPLFAHGGRLAAAVEAFPDGRTPWLDLSTGINPFVYPIPDLTPDSWARLPDPTELARLEQAASANFGVENAARVAAVPGSEIGLRLLAMLGGPARVAIASPTYASHGQAWTGHQVHRHAWPEIVADLDNLEVVIVVRPNNPDGQVVEPGELNDVAARLARRGGWLIIDEAFAEAGPHLPPAPDGAIRLRSFGKFFGLAGLRLGFVIADEPELGALRALLGGWPVSGPAIEIATRAYADDRWQTDMRARLADASERLDRMLSGHGWQVRGGTLLFRLIEDSRASVLFGHLGGLGILARPFADRPDWLRLGLPGSADQWRRLEQALALFPGEA